MAIPMIPGQVAVSDPNPGGPSATSNRKDSDCKTVKLSSANFTTTNSDNLVMVLPADSTIISIRLWVKTQLAGGSISAATIALGTASGGSQLVAASALAFGTAGAFTFFPVVSAIYQPYNIPFGADIQIFARGVSTGGNPTSGELYLTVEYVR